MSKQKFIDRLFPVKYNFYEMLSNQALMNTAGVAALRSWLTDGSEAEPEKLISVLRKTDDIRMDLEKNLIRAFSTPFDRGDIYSISIGMHRVIEYAQSTLISMKAYDVPANDIICSMVEYLEKGTEIFAEAVGFLQNDPSKSEQLIAGIRGTHNVVEQLYRDGMAKVFKSSDPVDALRHREVYHHIKDASSNLEDAVNILHKIVIRLT